jgi:hypothetical protein
MPSVFTRLLAALFLGLLAIPAHAEVEKFMQNCDGKLCAFFRASVTIPDGWVEDKEATQYFKAVMLLPAGRDFEKAQAKIYAVARYMPKGEKLSEHLDAALKDWRERAKDGKVTKLADQPRSEGKSPFVRHSFAARSLKEQGYEMQAIAIDKDKDGNDFAVTITLSANSEKALKDAEAAYLAVLAKY